MGPQHNPKSPHPQAAALGATLHHGAGMTHTHTWVHSVSTRPHSEDRSRERDGRRDDDHRRRRDDDDRRRRGDDGHRRRDDDDRRRRDDHRSSRDDHRSSRDDRRDRSDDRRRGNSPPPNKDSDSPPFKEPERDFGLSGKLAEETNTVNGVVVNYHEPPEAAKPTLRWRLYTFKNGEPLGEPLQVHRQSAYLFGREVKVADVRTDHPSCSKQHAVLQFRYETASERTAVRDCAACRKTEKVGEDGMPVPFVRPYLMDLGSTNGTFLNGDKVEAQRYYELLEKDVLVFGNSTREFVLLHERSGA